MTKNNFKSCCLERDNFQAWGKSTRRGDKEFICKGNVTKPHTIQQDINQILDKKSEDIG